MKTSLLIFYSLFLLTGCRNKERIPADIIPPPKMQEILWDMMRADQFLTDFVLNKDLSLNKNAESIKLYQKIFAIHQISKERFRESFSFYRKHPALFKTIMDSLSKPITEEPVRLAEPSALQDSLLTMPEGLPRADTTMKLRKRKRIPLN